MQVEAAIGIVLQAIDLALKGWQWIEAKAEKNQSFLSAESNRQLEKIRELLNEIIVNSKLPKVQTSALLAELMEQLLVKYVFSLMSFGDLKQNLLGLEGRLSRYLGEPGPSILPGRPIIVGPGIPGGYGPPEYVYPYPSISYLDLIDNSLFLMEILKYVLPTSWKFANSVDEYQDHWEHGFTPDEKETLLSEKEKHLLDWFAFPKSYSGPVLTNVEKLKIFLAMLMNSIGYKSDMNVNIYADLRLVLECRLHHFHTDKKLLDALLDRDAFKKSGNKKRVRVKESEIEKLEYGLYNYEACERLFGCPDLQVVESLVKSRTLRRDDLSEDILKNMKAEARTRSFNSVYDKLRPDIFSQVSREEVIALHCLIYKAIRLRYLCKLAIPKQADANIDRLSQGLGVTENQRQEMASRIELLYDLSVQGWDEAYFKVMDAIRKNKVPKMKYRSQALGFQTPFSFVKTSLLGQSARDQRLHQQQEWQEWAQHSIISLQSQLDFLRRQVEEAHTTDKGDAFDPRTATTLIKNLGSVSDSSLKEPP